MQAVITPDESRRLDREAGDPAATLMERAGYGVALAATRLGAGYGTRVAVLAGQGNNGGDGYVAAKYLARRGAAVTVHALGYPRGDGGPARAAAVAAVRAGVTVVSLGPPAAASLLIDALFGVGFRGTLPEAVAPWCRGGAPVVAVDVPSGLDAATGEVRGAAFTASRTVTFQARKTGHLLGEGPDRCGVVEVIDIGLADPVPEFVLCEDADAPIPSRERTAHKWSVGSVAVVGGAPGLTGAATLAARASLAGGAGSAAIICPEGLGSIYASRDPGILSHPIGRGDTFAADDSGAVLDASDRYDVLVLGPGLGVVPPSFVAAILDRRPGPLLLDADGLNALDGTARLSQRSGPTVLTPHAGEFRRLTGGESSLEAVVDLAAATGSVVLLKGNPTFVIGEERWAVTSGGPELATIGTGDVLAGMLGALWAGGLEVETAARSAAHWHGVVGARLAASRTVTAEAMIPAVAEGIGRVAAG